MKQKIYLFTISMTKDYILLLNAIKMKDEGDGLQDKEDRITHTLLSLYLSIYLSTYLSI